MLVARERLCAGRDARTRTRRILSDDRIEQLFELARADSSLNPVPTRPA